MKALILAGGGGTRLWPVSRRRSPKQVEAIIGDESLLQATYARLRLGYAARDIFVAASRGQAARIKAQLPRLPAANLILEPCRRDTASAIGFALLHLARLDPADTFVIINSDAYVRDAKEYLRVIRAADAAVRRHGAPGALIGIRPDYPETGYGYIRTGKLVGRTRTDGRTDEVYAVGRFVEKPDLATARRYLADGRYLWNPTLIVARIDRFLDLYRRHLPEHDRLFARMAPLLGNRGRRAAVDRLFAKLPSISIDYGILEKARGLLVLPADFGWADVGSWRAVRDILARQPADNVTKGLHVGIDSAGNLIYSFTGKLVATAGVCDMIIIETGDAILVCPRERAQDVKKIVSHLESRRHLKKYL